MQPHMDSRHDQDVRNSAANNRARTTRGLRCRFIAGNIGACRSSPSPRTRSALKKSDEYYAGRLTHLEVGMVGQTHRSEQAFSDWPPQDYVAGLVLSGRIERGLKRSLLLRYSLSHGLASCESTNLGIVCRALRSRQEAILRHLLGTVSHSSLLGIPCLLLRSAPDTVSRSRGVLV